MTFLPIRVTGALTVAAGLLAGAAVFAAPAGADPEVTDFLTTLDGLGLSGIDPGQAVAVGQSVCPLLAERGQNTADIASTVADALGRPLGAATMFTGVAISFFCPRAVQDLAGGRSPIPLPLLENLGF